MRDCSRAQRASGAWPMFPKFGAADRGNQDSGDSRSSHLLERAPPPLRVLPRKRHGVRQRCQSFRAGARILQRRAIFSEVCVHTRAR
jgi:hypothetical protein